MNYKVEGSLNKNRKVLIVALILWLLLAIVFVMPVAVSWKVAIAEGKFNSSLFFQAFLELVSNPMNSFQKIIKYGLIFDFIKTLFVFTLFYLIFVIIGLVKTAPKHNYDGMEHGSSDWSEKGEQYQILDRKKGIILAENNYLPVDKRGNINVLIVGRIRNW